jgi:hypothetical protein
MTRMLDLQRSFLEGNLPAQLTIGPATHLPIYGGLVGAVDIRTLSDLPCDVQVHSYLAGCAIAQGGAALGEGGYALPATPHLMAPGDREFWRVTDADDCFFAIQAIDAAPDAASVAVFTVVSGQ